ncbi:carboxyl-terminal protease [Candidatus Magnetomorum sp. HK-1]|nr:carboxyl-terminal protease [Candidatus Magnetomorum sp. HK-1]
MRMSNKSYNIFFKGFLVILPLAIWLIYSYPIFRIGKDTMKNGSTELISIIKKKAIFTPSDYRHETIKTKGVKAYLKGFDPYSDYLSLKEYQVFQNLQESEYVGVGMEVEKNKSGKVVCFPIKDEPAQNAGIEPGDILLAIDDTNIENKSLLFIASLSRGNVGSIVKVSVKKIDGNLQHYKIKRSKLSSKSVKLFWNKNIPVLKVKSFIISTKREIQSLLENLQQEEFIVIDVRNNPGGDLHSAIDSAMLFLKKNSPIVHVKSKNNTKTYYCTAEPVNSTQQLYLLQNEHTASAAEVFIAALTQNKRAVSMGAKTFGKGVKQSILELKNGDVVFLSTAFLLTPVFDNYHQKGLKPSVNMTQQLKLF